MVDIHELSALKYGLNRTQKESRRKEIQRFVEWIEKNADKIDDIGVDYIIIGQERAYFVERKQLTDLAKSIYSPETKVGGRFWEQLKRVREMATEFEKQHSVPSYAVLIAEGNIFARYRARFARFTPAQWMAIQVAVGELGVGLIRTWSINETILALEMLIKRSGKPLKKVEGLNIKKSLRSVEEEALHMLYAVSGVGEKKAWALLHRFGSVKNVVNADKEELVKVLGEKVGGHFYEVVNYSMNKELKQFLMNL